jgi:hypothetical protein
LQPRTSKTRVDYMSQPCVEASQKVKVATRS